MSDVVVVGGGIIGCAAAFELTRRGATVTVVEPRAIGGGASRASAGMLAPFSESRHDPVMRTLGIRSLALYDDLVLAATHDGARVPYSRAGSLDVAFDDDGVTQLRTSADELRREQVPSALLDASAVRQSEPSIGPAALAALRIDVHGYVGVSALVDALWRRTEAAGAQRVASEARSIAADAGGLLRVQTSAGSLDARNVVLAAGCWAGQIDVGTEWPLPVRPVRGQLLALGWDAPPLTRTLWGPRCYAVPWSDGTLLVGATVEEVGFDERATGAAVQDLLAGIGELAPRSRTAMFGGVRVGLRPATPDERPIVGRSDRVSGLVYATGHYRNGALLAPLTAAAVADMVEGKEPDAVWAACRPQRFGEF